MSYCQKKGKDGKDEIIVVTKEDHQKPISGNVAALSAALDDDDDDEPGFILPNGELNWNCPCVGGMTAGPCGYEFREAFSCFHHHKNEQDGMEACVEHFKDMHACMSQYPKVYGTFKTLDDEEDDDEGNESVFDQLDNSKKDLVKKESRH